MTYAMSALAVLLAAGGGGDLKAIFVMLLILAAIGVAAWAIVTYIPMPPILKGLVIIAAAVAAIFYLINTIEKL
jgi:hypothetical protein